MADTKFSALDPAGALSGTEIIPIIQSGVPVRTTPNAIASLSVSDVESVNSQTGDVVLDQDDIADGVTYKQYSATDKAKVGHIAVTQAVDLDTIESSLSGHIANTSNPHSVTKAQVGLGNADNTSDANKPVSTATQTALDGKVDENGAITGATKTKITYDAKGLVTAGADATTADIAEGANLYFTNERVDDRVDALIQDSATTAPGITWAYDDGAGTLTPTVLQSYDIFIYKSTGGQSGNRYNSWSDLMTAIAKQEGPKTIVFEQDETIPTGSWNLDYVTLKGNGNEYNAGGFTITFGNNTTISSWLTPGIDSLLLKSTSTTGHICTFTYPFSLRCTTVSNIQSSASYEFFCSSYAGQNIIALNNSARWSLIGTSIALFKFTGSAFGQQIILSRGDGSVVGNNTISSTNAQIYIDIIGSVNQNLANYPATHSGLSVGAGVYLGLTNVSALNFYAQTKAVADSPYTLASEVGYLRANAVGGNMTVNLPKAIGNGRLVTIKKIDASANTVTIDGDGTETIDGATTYVLTTQYQKVQMIDAAAGVWDIINTT